MLFICLPVRAQEQNGWQFDSLRENSSVSKSDAQQVYEVLLKMLDRWNAHDIEGHLEVYWKSPELLVVVDAEQFNGWQQLHDSYLNGYPDRKAMGFIQPKRIQVKLLKPNIRTRPHLVVGLFPELQANGGGEYHYEPPKV